jgi:CHAT domain-containing protein
MNVVVLEYYCLSDAIICLSFSKSSTSPVILELDINREEIGTVMLDWIKGYVKGLKEHRLCKSWIRFSEKMLDGIFQFTNPGDHLLIVPNDYLFHLPFHALTCDCVNFLIDRNSISYLPSLTLLRQAHARVETNGIMVGLAVEFKEEISKISDVCNMVTVLPPEGQSYLEKSFVLSLLNSNLELVHFTSHAQFGGYRPRTSRLLLKRGLKVETIREFLEAERFLLSAKDLLESKVNTRVIVLSGCETGMSHINPGDELEGLTTAFLVAGAKAVVSSLWQTFPFDAQTFFTNFYRHIKESNCLAQALRLSQQTLKDLTSDPLRWAPFVLYGRFV